MAALISNADGGAQMSWDRTLELCYPPGSKMIPKILFAAVLLTQAAGWAAGSHDPQLTWRTLTSERFFVHYPEGARNLGLRVSRLAEEELDRVAELVGYAPQAPIEIIITDAYDDANGWARVLPGPLITLRLAAPTELTGLSSYDDWLRILLIHELTHICVIDQTWGVTRVYDAIFGSYARLNAWVPHFLSEGVAVWAETVLTPTGRGRSSYVDMILRTAALDDSFLSIDRANLAWSDWPGGNAAYYYGGRFHLFLHARFGPDKVRELHQYYAAMPVPFVYWFGAEAVFGDSLPDLWERWQEEELAWAREVEAMVVAAGVTPSRRLTFHGRNLTGTRFSPDGSFIVYSRSSPYDGATVRRVDANGKNDRHLVLETYSPRFAFSPDGKSLFYSQSAINERFNQYNDLYRYDLESAETSALRDVDAPDEALRARDPDSSPDGRQLVFVQNRGHQSWVTIGTVTPEDRDLYRLRPLVPPWGDRQHASPRFSPDGERIAISTWFEGGKRDIVVVAADDGRLLRRVTNDTALAGNPAWTPDGRYLLFESDATGISNIYAYEWGTRLYYRVTNVVGGAFQADISPDGSKIIFRNASGIGFDIHQMPFDPGGWQALSYDPKVGFEPVAKAIPAQANDWVTPAWGVAAPRAREPAVQLRSGEDEEDYWSRSLVPFDDNWVLSPAFYLQGDDPGLVLTTFLVDSLGEHTVAASLGTSWYTREHLNWGLSYANDMWYPTFGVSITDQADAFASTAGTLTRRILSVAASVSWPIRLRHLARASYVFNYRERDPLLAEIWGLNERENYGRLEFGYTYRYTRRYPYSVGDEDGGAVAVAGRWYSKYLGGDFDELMLTLDARAYLNSVFGHNHVLALRFVTALAFGPDYRERFALGGWSGISFFTSTAAQSYPLRGFPLDARTSGPGVIAAYAEYRFPIWHIERGLWTIPLYVERLHGAVFAEGGNTFGSGKEREVGEVFEKAWRRIKGGRLGAGAELRIDLTLAWRLPLTIRGGLAFPVFDHGRPAFDTIIPYTSFGTTI